MRRHGNLFKKIVTPENIYLAYRKARKGKRWQRKVQAFEKYGHEIPFMTTVKKIDRYYTFS